MGNLYLPIYVANRPPAKCSSWFPAFIPKDDSVRQECINRVLLSPITLRFIKICTCPFRSAIQAMLFTLALLFPFFAFAQTYPTVDAYFAELAQGHQIIEQHSATVQTSSGERIFGIVCWDLETDPEELPNAEASVFILERTGSGLEVLAHSQPFEFRAKYQMFLELAIEASSKNRFKVTVLLQSRGVGFFEYRFIERNNAWYLAGLESSQSSIHMEEGDEAIGDSRTERSTNFLTGSTIIKTFHANKLASLNRTKKGFPKFPLEQFEIFDLKHEE